MPIKLQIRRGTASAWSSPTPSPTLLEGEIGLETDTGNVKIGTGTLTWAQLGYLASTLPQVSGAGTDFNAAAYRVQGRYEISTSVTTNPPSGWTPASDAPAILSVFRTANGHLVQVLTSVTTTKSLVRGYNGSAYTDWTPLTNFTDSVNTAAIVNLAVTTAKINDLAVTTDKIADDAVTNAKIRNSVGVSVIGRSDNSTGDPADIVAASDGLVLRRSGTTLGFGTVTADGLAAGSVTAAKLSAGVIVQRTTLHSTSGNWISPANVYAIRVLLVGGGAGGGAGFSTAPTQGQNGGSGGAISAYVRIQPSTTYSYTIGLGGAGNNNTVDGGGAGSSTTFLGLTANGGLGNGTTGTTSNGTQPAGVTLVVSSVSEPTYPTDTLRLLTGSGLNTGLVALWTPTSTFRPGVGGRGETNNTANNAGGGVSGCIDIEWLEFV